MANQKIPLTVMRFLNKLVSPARTQYRLAVHTQSVITEKKMVDNMTGHSGQQKSSLLAILSALPQAINDYLEAGNPVELPNLMTFKPRIKVKSHDAILVETDNPDIKEKVSAADILSTGVVAYPVGRLRDSIRSFQFEVLDTIYDEDEYEEEEGE